MNKLTEIKQRLNNLNQRGTAGFYAKEEFRSFAESDIEHLISLLEEKDRESVGFWELHERYEEKVWKCLNQADEIKRLNGILEEKDKEIERKNNALNDITFYPPYEETNNGQRYYEQMREIANIALNSSNNEGETI